MSDIYRTKRELISILFREKRNILGVFGVLFITTCGISLLMTPYYEANSRLLVRPGPDFAVRPDPSQASQNAPVITQQEIVNSEIGILTSRDLLQTVVNQIGPDKLYPGGTGPLGRLRRAIFGEPAPKTAPVDSTAAASDGAVNRFSSDLRVTPSTQSEVIRIDYLNPNRDMAVDALNALIKSYQDRHAQLFSAPQSEFLGQQAADYDSQFASVAADMAALKQKLSIYDPDEQRRQLIAEEANISSALQTLQLQSVDARQRIAFLSNQIKVIPEQVTAGQSDADAVQTAKSKMLDLQLQLQALRQRYSKDVKPILDVEAQIKFVQDFINGAGSTTNRKDWTQRNPAYDDAVLKLQQAQADDASATQLVAQRQTQLRDLNARLAKLEQGAQAIAELQRQEDQLSDLAKSFRGQYQAAQMSAELSSRRAINVSVIETASASDSLAKPKRGLFVLYGIVVGAIGAAGMVLFHAFFRDSLITAESVERIIKLPVLVAVPIRSRA